jgi:hypothetical protein
LDNAGKPFITGEYNAYAAFDTVANISLTHTGWADAFVAGYDASGKVQWAKSCGGPEVDRARGIGTDGSNIYITGQFGLSAAFDSFSVTGADSSDIFFASMDNAGNFLGAASVGGVADSLETLGYESGNAICADVNGDAYATGSLLDGGTFGSKSFGKYGRTDIFVTKISQLTGVGINELENSKSNISVYPNPSNGKCTVQSKSDHGYFGTLAVYNVLGEKIYTANLSGQSGMDKPFNIDLSTEKKGIYFIEIQSEGQPISRGKIILQ